MFYRLIGGGEVHHNLHLKKPRLAHMLKSFTRQSKMIIHACGSNVAHLFTQAYHTKSFILGDYGIHMHVPALRAELCLDPGVSERLHMMLITIRAIKQGPLKGMIKASASPLPRVEPWESIVAKNPHPLPQIVLARKQRNIANITIRGERGDGRDLRQHPQ